MSLARTRPDPTPGDSQLRAASVRAVNKKARTIEVVASTETVDSHGTILLQDWDLARFERNPVVLWAHNQGDDVELPIGRAVARVEANELIATIEFAPESINPFAESVFQHYAAGFLRAVSVGFDFRSYRWEMRGDVEVLVLFGLELLELSCVPVGSNADALARSIKSASKTAPTRGTTEKTPMTEEEKALLAFARAALALMNTTDPAAGEATLRGLIDVRADAEKTGAELAKARKALSEKRAAEVISGAIRDAKLPPRAEWTEEQRAYIESLSADAAEGQRSPLDAYVATLTRRVPVTQREQPKTGPAAPEKRETPVYARNSNPKYTERAQSEKAARRSKVTTTAQEGD